MQFNGRHALLDPYLSDSLTVKYEKTDKPHVRMTERVIAPERLGFVDVVTSSHNHTDHLDAETLQPLFATNPDAKLVIPSVNRATVAERVPGVEPVGVEIGTSVTIDSFTIQPENVAIDAPTASPSRRGIFCFVKEPLWET